MMNINILGKPGPRSIAGKNRSKMNAVQSGAFAKTKVLPHESETEYLRLSRELTKSFKPTCSAQKLLIQQMVDALWASERFRLRLMYKQEVIFKELSPNQLAVMIPVPDIMVDYAPEYLLNPNTKFSVKELKLLKAPWGEFVHFHNNAKGTQNYDVVYSKYQILYEKLDEYMKAEHQKSLLMSHRKNIELEFQQQPKLFEHFMYEFAAWMYYRIHLEKLKPDIRVAMSTWFFLQRTNKKESDYQDEGVMRELKRYQSLQDSYLKLQKSLDEHLRIIGRLETQKIPNELTDSVDKTDT